MSDASRLSLQDQLRANDEAFAKTGHVFGLDKLARKASDPGTYEAVSHILSNLCNAAWSVGCKVSSSPIAAEGGDALWALHTPTGEAICVSRGITAHPGLLAAMVRNFIELGYEDYPEDRQLEERSRLHALCTVRSHGREGHFVDDDRRGRSLEDLAL